MWSFLFKSFFHLTELLHANSNALAKAIRMKRKDQRREKPRLKSVLFIFKPISLRYVELFFILSKWKKKKYGKWKQTEAYMQYNIAFLGPQHPIHVLSTTTRHRKKSERNWIYCIRLISSVKLIRNRSTKSGEYFAIFFFLFFLFSLKFIFSHIRRSFDDNRLFATERGSINFHVEHFQFFYFCSIEWKPRNMSRRTIDFSYWEWCHSSINAILAWQTLGIISFFSSSITVFRKLIFHKTTADNLCGGKKKMWCKTCRWHSFVFDWNVFDWLEMKC